MNKNKTVSYRETIANEIKWWWWWEIKSRNEIWGGVYDMSHIKYMCDIDTFFPLVFLNTARVSISWYGYGYGIISWQLKWKLYHFSKFCNCRIFGFFQVNFLWYDYYWWEWKSCWLCSFFLFLNHQYDNCELWIFVQRIFHNYYRFLESCSVVVVLFSQLKFTEMTIIIIWFGDTFIIEITISHLFFFVLKQNLSIFSSFKMIFHYP